MLMQMNIHDVEKALPAMRGSQGNNADDAMMMMIMMMMMMIIIYNWLTVLLGVSKHDGVWQMDEWKHVGDVVL